MEPRLVSNSTLEFLVLMSVPPKCWGYRDMSCATIPSFLRNSEKPKLPKNFFILPFHKHADFKTQGEKSRRIVLFTAPVSEVTQRAQGRPVTGCLAKQITASQGCG